MLSKEEIMELLRTTGFSPDSYWVVAGAAMVLHHVKKRTRDIDLGCTKELADDLQQQGFPADILEDASRRIRYSDKIELFEDWKEGTIEMTDDIPVVSLDGLILMKRQLGRKKDLEDIKLIERHMARRRQLLICEGEPR